MSGPGEPTSRSAPVDDTESEGDEAYCAACNQSFSLEHMFCPNDGARLVKLVARPDQLIGRVFDHRYEIRAVLGHGGMGTVYRGWQLSVDREIAIKVIHPKLASVRAVAKRFLREARLSSRLSEPTIVAVYDFGQTDDGILYIVMELLRGHPLSRDLETRRPLPVRRITALASQICDALDAAHALGIVHRDLKPHNIIVLDDPPGRDRLKILDFGLAKSLVNDDTSLVTQSDALLGTPLYMPPEQILGRPSDQRADLYSLGCMLYQMASGRPPFVGDNINVVLGAHLRDAPPPLLDGVPPRLAALIARLMSKAPEDRPATAALVQTALTTIAETDASGLAARAPATPADSIAPRPRARRWAWLTGLAALAVAAGTAIGLRVATSPAPAAGGAPPAPASDAAPSPASDAASRAPIDAAPAVDAGTADAAPPPVDAPRAGPDPRRPPRQAHRDAGPEPRATPDAAAPRPLDAGGPRPGDAGLPDLDLLPTRP